MASFNGINKFKIVFRKSFSFHTMTSRQSNVEAHQTGGALIVMSRRVGPAQPRVKGTPIELSSLEPRGSEKR